MSGTFMWYWIGAVYAVLLIIPTARILKRVGFSPWWSVVVFIAPLNIIMLWVFAFVSWPSLPDRRL